MRVIIKCLILLELDFFWQGTGKERKYHMVKWAALNRPKEFGGLGFLDVRVMNKCLLAKWIDKLERGNDRLCCSLLRKKYLGHRSIFQIKPILEIFAGHEILVSKRKNS